MIKMSIKEAKEDLKTLRMFFEEHSKDTYPGVLMYCYFMLTAIENNDKELMNELLKGEKIDTIE